VGGDELPRLRSSAAPDTEAELFSVIAWESDRDGEGAALTATDFDACVEWKSGVEDLVKTKKRAMTQLSD
jgi:hypothetical protein